MNVFWSINESITGFGYKLNSQFFDNSPFIIAAAIMVIVTLF
jgi:hypothetical protein